MLHLLHRRIRRNLSNSSDLQEIERFEAHATYVAFPPAAVRLTSPLDRMRKMRIIKTLSHFEYQILAKGEA
jgi:hypothetical protein